VGSLLFGFIIAKGIFEYQKNNFVLDEVEVSTGEEKDGFIPTFLDLSSPSHPREGQSQVMTKVQDYLEEKYHGDEEEINNHIAHVPEHIFIPSIGLDSEIGFAGIRDVEVFGKKYQQWIAPDDVVGWHFRSALLGRPGNTVFNGHHNINGEVFRDLYKVRDGDEIILRSQKDEFHYMVVSTMILPERFESEEVRLQNAKWIQSSEDERITLVTCWPYESNTHRVIVVAYPIDNKTSDSH
jgi:sortase A